MWRYYLVLSKKKKIVQKKKDSQPFHTIGKPNMSDTILKNQLKVHILGAGAIGSLVAHDLKQKFPTLIKPILLLKQESLVEPSLNHPINVTRLDDDNQEFISKVEVQGVKPQHFKDTIENLIVTTKSYQTLPAIRPYLSHILPNTNILFLQNGMGVTNTLINKYWSDQARPNIYEGITTHGVYVNNGIVHHVGRGQIALSTYPGKSNVNDFPALIQCILDTPNLNANHYEYPKFLLMQLEKLIVNCCVNPFTALFDCRNGELLYGNNLTFTWKRIINEAKHVFVKEYTILNTIPDADSFLNTDRLLKSVVDVCKITAKNSSSMRQDVRNLRNTEIQNLNGYISFLGRKLKVGTPVNDMVTNMILSKINIDRGIDRQAADSLSKL